ncbi:MAG: hypothetical protein AB7I18_00810 [Candidatus Berkiella sp.]
MGQKQSAETPQYSKSYTTDELIHLIDDYEASFADDKNDSENEVTSTNQFSKAMPNQRWLLLCEAFKGWDFMRAPSRKILPIKEELILQVNGAFRDMINSLNKLWLNNSNKLEKITEMLAPPAEYRRPSLVYDTQMLIISFITRLTQEKFYDEAKALHRFIRVFKTNIQVQPDPDEQKGIAQLTTMACVHALQLQDAAIVEGHLLERSQRDKFFHFYLAATLYLTIRHPVFDNDYSIETYDIYVRMNNKFDLLHFGISVNPALAAEDLPDFFLETLKTQYAEIAKRFYRQEDKGAEKAIYDFFIKKIASVAAFDKTLDRAGVMHNFIYVLKMLYQEDASNPKDPTAYVKALRNFLQIPRLEKDIDAWFDECIVRSVFERKRGFRAPFNPERYAVSLEEQQEYCKHLTQAYEEQVEQNAKLSAQLQQETFSLKVRNNELQQQLAALQEELRKLSIGSAEDRTIDDRTLAIPSLVPPSSPSMGIYHLHRREKPSSDEKASRSPRSSDSSSPRERRKGSSPPPVTERPSLIGRALSADALKSKKFK